MIRCLGSLPQGTGSIPTSLLFRTKISSSNKSDEKLVVRDEGNKDPRRSLTNWSNILQELFVAAVIYIFMYQ